MKLHNAIWTNGVSIIEQHSDIHHDPTFLFSFSRGLGSLSGLWFQAVFQSAYPNLLASGLLEDYGRFMHTTEWLRAHLISGVVPTNVLRNGQILRAVNGDSLGVDIF